MTSYSQKVYHNGPFHLLAREENGYICQLDFFTDKEPEEISSPLLETLFSQLDEYFSGTRKEFTVPIALSGTVFQKQVWQALMEVPYGQVRSYSEIAQSIGHPKACRAVGSACHNNSILLLVPCHRVIGKDGKLHGFGNHQLDLKTFLLQLEKQTV